MKPQAGPGYVIYRRMRVKGREKTKGGIILPEKDEKRSSDNLLGQCIDAGEHVATGRTGRLGGGLVIRERGWLLPGSIFEIKPVSEQPSRLAPGIYSCIGEQVAMVWAELPDGVELEPTEV